VEIDGQVVTGRALLVCVANGGTYGGGMRVCPDARVDDGALDITWVEDIPRAQFLRVLPRVFSGAHVRHPSVRTYSGTSVRVEANDQIAYADGERLGALPIRIAARPGALRIIDTAVA
jgi:diacylglycerol kinase (ATP)